MSPAPRAVYLKWLAVLIVGLAGPAILHAGIVGDHLRWAGLWWPGVAVCVLGAVMLRRARVSVLLAFAGCVAFLVWTYLTQNVVALFAPSLAVNLLLMWTFSRTLTAGNEPLITRIARIERARAGIPFPDELQAYTRDVTWLWSGFFAVNATVLLTLALAAPLKVWSFYANVLNLPLVVMLFAGEYIYRRRRFARHLDVPLWRLAMNIAVHPSDYFGALTR
jgi:uncharacterized membrane protein